MFSIEEINLLQSQNERLKKQNQSLQSDLKAAEQEIIQLKKDKKFLDENYTRILRVNEETQIKVEKMENAIETALQAVDFIDNRTLCIKRVFERVKREYENKNDES